MDLINKKMNVYIYKYFPFTSIEHASSIICESKFWMSSPEAFNDPFDMQWKYQIESNPILRRKRIEQILKNNPDLAEKSWIKRKSQIDKIMADPKRLEKNIHAASRRNIASSGVVCFSQDPKSILMWSHYANNHQGLVFQLDVSLDPNVFLKAVKVEYCKDYPVIEWTDLSENALKKGLLRKYTDWQYEKERRYFKPNSANKFLKFNSIALTGIIMGCRFSEDSFKNLRDLLERRQALGCGVPKLYRAEQDTSAYSLSVFSSHKTI